MQQQTNYIQRDEYEKRHSALEDRLNKLEAADSEMQRTMGLRFDRMSDKIDSIESRMVSRVEVVEERMGRRLAATEKVLSDKIDSIITDGYTTKIKVLVWIVSAVVGSSGIFTILQVFHLVR